MQQVDQELKDFMTVVGSAKSNFFSTIHDHLRNVSSLQSQIRDFENSQSMLRDALAVHKRQFAELEHIKRLPGNDRRKSKFHHQLYTDNLSFRCL